MVEPNKQGKVSVVWIVHGSQLIRAAPEHLRYDHLGQEHPGSPKEALDSVRGRGTTTFLDLSRTNRGLTQRDVHMLDTDDEQKPALKSRRRMPAPATHAEPSPPVLCTHRGSVIGCSGAQPLHCTNPAHPVLLLRRPHTPLHQPHHTPCCRHRLLRRHAPAHPVLPSVSEEPVTDPLHTPLPADDSPPATPPLCPTKSRACR